MSNGTCIKCSYYTYLTSSGTCSACKNAIPNCLACYSEANTSSPTNSTLYCRQCSHGYYAAQTQCLACSPNCLECFNSGACIACAQEYRLNGTSCIRCVDYC